MKHPKHGGKREGAGAKRLAPGEATEILKVPLPASVKAEVLEIGGSTWVRDLIYAALARRDRKT